MSADSTRPHRYGRHVEGGLGEAAGRAGRRPVDEPRPYRGEGYYGLPVVKTSPWGWLIASYFFVGGLAGAAQLIATIAQLFGGPGQRPVVRAGRYLAFAGTVISPVLLTLDLHTPSRWYNMLRIVRRTSPMSIGSWVLATFGFASSVAAGARLLIDMADRKRLARIEQVSGAAGAVTGAVMATYTATLLSGTSTPLWLTASRHLPVLFGSTAMASAVAAISLALQFTNGSFTHWRPLSILALVAATGQWWSARAMERSWTEHGVRRPRDDSSLFAVDTLLVKCTGVYAPMLVNTTELLMGRALRPFSALASVATLVGAFAERWLMVRAGNDSANRPDEYFRVSQPAGDTEHGQR